MSLSSHRLALLAACLISTAAFGQTSRNLQVTATPSGMAAEAAAAAPVAAYSIHDIFKALDSRPVDARKLADNRRIAELEPPEGMSGRALADFYMTRSRAQSELGLVGPQIASLRKAIELGGGAEPYRAWAELGAAEFMGGNFRSALDARRQALVVTPERMRGFQLAASVQLADLYRRVGDFDTARKYVRDAEGLLVMLRRGENWANYEYNWSAFVEQALGQIEFSAGHYTEAVSRFSRALDYREKDLAISPERERRVMNAPPTVNIEHLRDASESWLSSALRAEGNLAEAEVHARRLAYRCIESYGPESLAANIHMNQLVAVLLDEGKNADALLLIDRIQRNLEKLQVPNTSYFYVQMRRFRASALTSQMRWKEAIAEYEALRAALAADPLLIETMGGPNLGWVRALIAEKRGDEAAEMGQKLAAQLRAQMGDKAYDAAEAAGFYGAALASAGRSAEALDILRQAVATMIPAVADQADRSGRRFQRLSFIIETYLHVLARVRGTPLEASRKLDAAGEAFVVADVLRGQSVQQAMAASAARAAASTPELAQLVRQEQDVRKERDALYKILADLMSRPADQMLPQVVNSMQTRATDLDRQQKDLTQQIQRRFPDYADLASPRPATIAAVQAVLRPGEALISILPSSDRTFIWAIPAKGAPVFASAERGKDDVNRAVEKLRTALDPKQFDLERLPVFDSEVAYKLYSQLLAPVEAGWKDSNHLIVAAGGALSRLPFALLLTQPTPAPAKGDALYASYRDWPWLIRDRAVSQLPAASSLSTLRRMKAGAASRLAFAGFGDPDFAGTGRTDASSRRGVRAVPFASNVKTRALPGEEAPKVDYSQISPLPDTRDEILSLAHALGADTKRDVFLGPDASKQKVLTSDLAHRKVVAFATHGLLSGEYPGVDQPALALANPGNGQHGLLTLDDILGLKLDADWVVLSACNTAGGDGESGEAVSGLGRGFFYAGSRSLLVTHWPVESVSAKRLVVGIFDALSASPDLSRAEALRRSMLKVMADRNNEGGISFSYAHPLFWAPYALVGDGGK